MNNKILGITIFVFAFFFCQVTFAEDDGWKCGDRLKEMVKTLKLDNGQQAKIQVTQDLLRAHMKPHWEKMKSLHEQINQQIQSENMDETKLGDLINAKAQLIGKVMKEKSMAQHQIYLVLNPKQRTQYQQMTKKWDKKVEKMFAKCHKDE